MRGVGAIGIVAVGTAIVMASPASSKDKQPAGPPPPMVNALLDCQKITDSAQRLACYDKSAAAIGEAVAKQDLVVFDRESVRETKKGLFGFSLPNLGIFGDEANEISQIEGELVSFGYNADGGYIFRLADGSRWSQQDGKPIAVAPQNGDMVIVKKGALGSFMLSVEKQPGVKVKRVN